MEHTKHLTHRFKVLESERHVRVSRDALVLVISRTASTSITLLPAVSQCVHTGQGDRPDSNIFAKTIKHMQLSMSKST